MRKEVKLGMTIGGGLIALLVVYMLVAPPSNQNKGGALLATGDKGGNIIDPAQQPVEPTPASDERSSAHSTADNGGGLPLGKVPEVQPTKVQEVHEQPAPAGAKDGWKDALDKGRKPSAESPAPRDNTAKPTPATPKPAPKSAAPKTVATRHESHETHEIAALGTPAQASEAKLYYNPNDAWGGGVSTDGILATSESTPKKKVASHKEPTESTPVAAGGGGKHVVQSGDTLSSIAQAAYGSASYYPHILRANPTVNPNNLKLGTELTLPKLDEVKATDTPREHTPAVASVSQDVKIDTTHQYQVQSGDSLYKISLKVYGKSTYVEKIYEMNKATIGADPKKLKLGMILELPEKTTVATAAPAQGGNSEASDENERR